MHSFDSISIGQYFISEGNMIYQKTSADKAAFGKDENFSFDQGEVVFPIYFSNTCTNERHSGRSRAGHCQSCKAEFNFKP